MTQSAVHTSRMSAAKKNKVWTLIVDNGGTAGGRLTGPPPWLLACIVLFLNAVMIMLATLLECVIYARFICGVHYMLQKCHHNSIQ